MNKLLLVVIAILLPPLAVGLKDGIGTSFWINILLTVIGFYVLGLIHALYIILTT